MQKLPFLVDDADHPFYEQQEAFMRHLPSATSATSISSKRRAGPSW
jgi:hypothetical protein